MWAVVQAAGIVWARWVGVTGDGGRGRGGDCVVRDFVAGMGRFKASHMWDKYNLTILRRLRPWHAELDGRGSSKGGA